MRIRVIAVGSRTPSWVRECCEEYAARLRARLQLAVVEIAPGTRGAKGSAARATAIEAARLLDSVQPKEFVVALDEHGEELTTRELASWLERRLRSGRDLAFLIGGADGLAPDVLARADFKWALSRLTLPHRFARMLLVEQLYRAMSLLDHHPYHRE